MKELGLTIGNIIRKESGRCGAFSAMSTEWNYKGTIGNIKRIKEDFFILMIKLGQKICNKKYLLEF